MIKLQYSILKQKLLHQKQTTNSQKQPTLNLQSACLLFVQIYSKNKLVCHETLLTLQQIQYNILKSKLMNIKLLLACLSFISTTLSFFLLDVNSPFSLTSNKTNITTLASDSLTNGYLIGFQNGQARRYTKDFASFTSLYAPEIVDQFSSWSTTLNNIQLSNGTVWSMNATMTVSLSNTYKTVRTYSFPTHTQIQSYNFPQAILDYRGFPISTPPNVNPLHVVVFNRTIKVLYKGTVNTAFDLTTAFGASINQTAVTFYKSAVTFGGDNINLTLVYFESLAMMGLAQINVVITLQYNYATLNYDMSATSTNQVVSTFLYVVTSMRTSMMTANPLVLIQVSGGGLLIRTSTTTSPSIYSDPYILNNPILQIVNYNSIIYILFSSGLISININTSTGQMSGSALISTAPNNTYKPSFGSVVTVLYVPNTPYIYKTICAGQTYDNWSGGCIAYSCKDVNCLQCQLTATTCGTCAAGYYVDDNLICSNATSFNNSTNTTNKTSNATNPMSSTNTTNTTKTTNSTTNNATNSTKLNTTAQQPTSNFYSLFPILAQFPSIEELFMTFVNSSTTAMSVPSLRSIAPIFLYFGNFDDIYLYMFHDRLYGTIMSQLFTQINTLQTQKWSVINFDDDFKWLNTNSSVYNQINFQNIYLTYNYTTPNHPIQGSEGLLYNCFNFLSLGVPMVIIAFILLRFLFRLLFKFSVSRIFRRFDLWGYLVIIIFDGNVQQFAFYLTADLRNVFFFSFVDRCIKTWVVFFGFLLTIVSIGGFLVGFAAYRKLNKHLIQNNHNNVKGNAYMLLQFGFRNLLLGVCHSFLRQLPYTTMLIFLIAIEMLFFFIFMISAAVSIYRTMICIWTYLLLTFIRILLIFTLFFDYSLPNSETIESVQCILIFLMIFIYLVGTFIAVFTTIASIFTNFVKLFKDPTLSKGKRPTTTSNQTFQQITYYLHQHPKEKKKNTYKSRTQRPKNIFAKTKKGKTIFRLVHKTIVDVDDANSDDVIKQQKVKIVF